MAMDSGSVDIILDFLRRNKFSRAEAALRSELVNRIDLIGIFEKLSLNEKGLSYVVEERKQDPIALENQCIEADSGSELFDERINKEFELEYESGRKDSVNDLENTSTVWCKTIDAEDANSELAHDQISEGCVINSVSKKLGSMNAGIDSFSSNDGLISSCLPGIQTAGVSQPEPYSQRKKVKSGETDRVCSQNGSSWAGSSSRVAEYSTDERNQARSSNEEHLHVKFSSKSVAGLAERESSGFSRDKQTCVPETRNGFPCWLQPDVVKEDALIIGDTTEGTRTTDSALCVSTIGEKDDGCGGSLGLKKDQIFSESLDCTSRVFSFVSENQREEFPQLRPVRLKSEEKVSNREERFEQDYPSVGHSAADNNFHLGSFLDSPIGQDMTTSGGKKNDGGSWLSVSRGISEDTTGFVSGFGTLGDGFGEMIVHPNEFWDSDEYEDDDDVGYIRQPIGDETWFLAHEIDCPSDNEKCTGHGTVSDSQQKSLAKEEDQSFAEEDSYFSGEHFLEDKIVEPIDAFEDPLGISVNDIFGTAKDDDMVAQYDGQLMDEEEINLMRAEPVWQGFVTRRSQTSEIMFDDKCVNKHGSLESEGVGIDEDQYSSVRSIGVGINSDAADFCCEVRESFAGRSNEGDLEYTHDHDVSISGSTSSYVYSDKILFDGTYTGRLTTDQLNYDKYVIGNDKGSKAQMKSQSDGGFSFPQPSGDKQALQSNITNENWCNSVTNDFNDSSNDCMNISRSKDGSSCSRSRSSGSSSDKDYIDENIVSMERLGSSPFSKFSNVGSSETSLFKIFDDTADARGKVHVSSFEDEEAIAVQEQVRQIQAQEDEFEIFNLKIVHRKNRTGFEEDKNFHVVLNSVIAGRYHVTEHLGSAAFSKAIQAHDLHTGMDVCVKIIKNNKDFFDQSLDEIKLLKYVNKNDPADKYHILRLYDYFYYHEHLLIVSELLKANLYEFQKFNRDSGGEVYFTMPRLQSVAIQCLEALQFLHGLGLIHCDLKPENILIKSYSRCEVKVIDLGSSCYETDHLCSYVQSRSYRAPEVILGLPYDKKIDIWSLGCIMAELCTGNVLFQNDSPATLLARVIGIIGSIDQEMLAKGKDTYKYLTKNHMLYERNQETSKLEYLIPKKTSLHHRLPMGDQSFTEFVAHLLEINPNKRPSATEALNHPWLSYPYEPISS